MQKSAFERTGLVPRSIIRTFDRFRRQLLPGAEDLVIQEFRVSKYQVLVSVRCLASLLFLPLLVNYLVKTTILIPLAEYIWNTQQNEIFLNFYQENRAFLEMRDFEEKTFFESLVSVEPKQSDYDTLHFADKMQVLHKTQNYFDPIRAQHAELLLAKPVKVPENDISRGKSTIVVGPEFLPIKEKEPKLNEINFERFIFLSKSKFNRISSNFLTKNSFFKENKTKEIQGAFGTIAAGHGYHAESMTALPQFPQAMRAQHDCVPFCKAKCTATIIATGHQSNSNCATHYGFATPSEEKQKQETTFFTTTKNSSLVSAFCDAKCNTNVPEASLRLGKKNLFFSNQENILPVLSDSENLTKFDFVKQNLPIAHLNCQGNLCGQKIHFLSEDKNKKIKSFSKINGGEATIARSANVFSEEEPRKHEILLQKKFQEKTIQLATFYNQQTISAIANVFGDFVTLITIAFLFVLMKPQIIILKSFLTESIYSLSDTTKSFLLILLTDLLVGFHSPRGWEILIEILLRHFGLPENQDFVFLFVATLPVLLDTVFKYWIFRYLNQISPSTVATYHSMIE